MPKKYVKSYKRKGRKKTFKKKGSFHLPMRILPGRPAYSGIFNNSSTLSIINNSTADTNGALIFKASDCLGISNYVDIFDYYRINWVKVTFEPCRTQLLTTQTDQTTAPSSLTQVPLFITCIDRDSLSAPLNYEALQKRGNVKETLASRKQEWKFTPNRLTTMFETVSTQGLKIDKGTYEYLDLADTDVPHFGMKWSMKPSQPITGYKTYIRIEYSLSFKGKRA